MICRPRIAVVRRVSESYPRCLRTSTEKIDLVRAEQQHEAYVDLLRHLGIEVHVLPPLNDLPDAVFVEDTAVILGSQALITRPGAPARRSEATSMASILSSYLDVQVMEPPATLDGGDVLRIGMRLFVGLSGRTNAAGADLLAAIAAKEGIETHRVSVGQGLHLKSACTALNEREVVLVEGHDPTPFEQGGLSCVSVREPFGGNVLSFGSDVIVSAAAEETGALLADRGQTVHPLEVSEFHKGDGALTCLSLRIQ